MKDTFDPEILWKLTFEGIASIGNVFFSCEIGQRFTDAFNEIVDEFEQFDWYLFPPKIQRILPTTLIGVQKPVVIGCFGTFEGSRDQFKKVLHNKIFNWIDR